MVIRVIMVTRVNMVIMDTRVSRITISKTDSVGKGQHFPLSYVTDEVPAADHPVDSAQNVAAQE
jgi:hypothetical protein